MSAPIDRVRAALEDHGFIVNNGRAQCPGHDDRTPSLSITEDDRGVGLKCHAGCETGDVVGALGLRMADLFADPAPPSRNGDGAHRAPPAGSAEYVYQRADGTEFAKVVRRAGKKFHQVHRVGEHYEFGGCPELNTTLYRLPEVLAAAADGRQILVVEGERDVETAREYGVTATCSVGGSSGGWKAEHTAALVGADVLVVRDRDDPGRAHAERVRAALSGRARSVRVVEPVPGHKGADLTDHVHAGYGVEDLADVETVATGRQSRITWASQIEPEPVVWAWTTEDGHGRVPAGSQVIAAGREGTGKSSFAIWMAAQISRGTLPGAFHGTPRRVLYVTVEDSWKHTIVPRLIAAGADLSMIGRFDVITESGADGALSLPHDNDLLESEIIRHEVAATMVDPLMSAVAQKIDTHREREVRTALDPLTALADRTGAVILGIAHFNKSSGTDVSNLITASGAFKNVARAVLGFARDDDGRVMTQTKNSLGRDDLPSLSYTLTPVDIPTPKGTAATARFDFTGPSSRSVEDLLRDAKETSGDPDERAERDHAVDWLNKYLNDKGGTAPFQDIREAAQKVDIPERTLQRVRHRAGVRSRRRGFQQGAIWSIDSDHPRRARESPQGGMTGGIGSDQGERTGADDEPGADDWSVSAGHAQSGHSRRSMDSPQDPGADRPCCSRCRHPSDHPLINGRCRSCAYPPGTDSPYREEN